MAKFKGKIGGSENHILKDKELADLICNKLNAKLKLFAAGVFSFPEACTFAMDMLKARDLNYKTITRYTKTGFIIEINNGQFVVNPVREFK